MFKPYKGNDVKQGPGGYVLIDGVWRALLHTPGAKEHIGTDFVVTLLGWGETFGGLLEDYTPEQQALLKTTLTTKENAAVALGAKGGSVKSEAKAKAARENAKKGGRPKKEAQE